MEVETIPMMKFHSLHRPCQSPMIGNNNNASRAIIKTRKVENYDVQRIGEKREIGKGQDVSVEIFQ